MTFNAVVLRFIRRYVLSVEALCVAGLGLLLYAYLAYGFKIWLIFRSRVIFRAKEHDSDRVNRLNPSLFGTSAFTPGNMKAIWEDKKNNMAVFSIQGRRPHMEDRFNNIQNVEDSGISVYGVFDGHGGEFAADFVEKLLFRAIMLRLMKAGNSPINNMRSEDTNFSSLLTEEILKVDKQLISLEVATKDASGTTALIAVHAGQTLTVANVGDSRAVLCDHAGKSVPLSYDHKPDQIKEKQRIQDAGGFVSFNGVWRVAGILATSRALGDYPLKEDNLVIANPDTLTFDLRDHKPQFMILATDGLWDTFSNDEAVEFIKERLDEPLYGAKSLTLKSYDRGSLDNVTVMVVKFGRETFS